MRPFVSVIVPCYNCENSVIKTLDSLRNQTINCLEIIAINDGSKDHTLEVLEDYKNKYPSLDMKVYSKQNEGIAECRNFGLSKVTGKYFGFLDSDDYTDPNMFKDLYEYAIKDHLQVVVSDFYWVNSKGETLQKDGPYEKGPDMMVNLFAVLWNKLYETDFVKGLDVKFPYGCRYEDACFLYCLTPHIERLGFINKAYVRYVQHENSITHTNNDEVKDMVEVFKIILKYYRDHNLYKEYKEALEYIHIKFFLGNSFLRSSRIQDKKDREQTIHMGWDLLNDEFPDWHNNNYLKSLGGMKNRYFRMVNDHNIMLFAWIFRNFKKENL